MNINMYDVNFGDCFVFENQKNSLIIDCGTKSKESYIAERVSEILELYIDKKEECHALITHFHEDHIKGFKYMEKSRENIFDKFYIPYILATDKEGIDVFAEEIIILYLFLSKASKGYITSLSILEHMHMVVKLVKNTKGIVCLHTGKNINFDDTNYEVIWPDKREESFKKIDKHRKNISILNNIVSNDMQLSDIISRFSKNIVKWFEVLEGTNDNNYREKEILNVLTEQDAILQLLKDKRTIYSKRKLDKKQVAALREISKQLSCTMNENSIVFHNKLSCNDLNDINRLQEAEDDEEEIKGITIMRYLHEGKNTLRYPILMMGDVTIKVIDTYLINRFHKCKYEYLKVPHHGTSTHYSSNIPSSYNLLISTGKFRRYKKIYLNYKEHIINLGERICTSGYPNITKNACEIRESGDVCMNARCNVVGALKHILPYNYVI